MKLGDRLLQCDSNAACVPRGAAGAAHGIRVRAAVLAAVLLLTGCATTTTLPRLEGSTDTPATCRALFASIDLRVDANGVQDAGADRIDGFPWLRINRPLASFRLELDSPARREAWLRRLAALDAEARGHELANVARADRDRLRAQWREVVAGRDLPGELGAGQAQCRQRLNERLAQNGASMERLVAAAVADDEYQDWKRVLGLYPLTRHIVLPRVATHQAARRRAIAAEPGSTGPNRSYAVPLPTGYRPDVQVPGLQRDALGIPLATAQQRAALFALHAPIWSIETLSAADQPGALVRTAARPEVDTTRPAEYRQWSWTRFRGEVLVQLSYVVWFPERPPEDGLDIYAGHLDGLIWRVTLDTTGAPLAYETIHPCGCYYTLFPARGWHVRPMESGEEPVLAPIAAPRPGPGERVVVRLEARTHYVAGLHTRTPAAAAWLAPLPLTTLRSLPLPAGGNRSVFAGTGVIPESRRLERFLLWPLGVRSPGAMRQWGTHAIAFVGKRHFDDPRLLDSLLVRDGTDDL